MLLNASKLSRNGWRKELILLDIKDITERVPAERHQEALMDEPIDEPITALKIR